MEIRHGTKRKSVQELKAEEQVRQARPDSKNSHKIITDNGKDKVRYAYAT